MQDALNVAATHVTPQSPAPKPDEAPNVVTTPEEEKTTQGRGVLANRAGDLDLLHDDIGNVNAAVKEEKRMSRPGLSASRVGSVSRLRRLTPVQPCLLTV
jgi:hypothetical protein